MMTLQIYRLGSAPIRRVSLILAAVAALFALALACYGPIAQWPGYHAFADQRAAFNIPHAADVLSNLPFALAGCWALAKLGLQRHATPSTAAWRAFAAALACTALGSAAYHWAPDNAALVFDRLPIALASAALLCAFLAERVDTRFADPLVLGMAMVAGGLSVAVWWSGERNGPGDLRAYLFVHFLPMLLVPAGLVLHRHAPVPGAVPARAWWFTLAGYAAAKLFELGDVGIWRLTEGAISGHTLKHLMAASAAACILRAAVQATKGIAQLR